MMSLRFGARSGRILRTVGLLPALLTTLGVAGASTMAFADPSGASAPSDVVVSGSDGPCSVTITIGASSATATVTGCSGPHYYLSSWAATSPTYSPTLPQTLVDSTNQAPWTVQLPTTSCYYQVDFAYRSSPPGTPAEVRDYIAGHLGTIPGCGTTTTTTTTIPTTTTTAGGSGTTTTTIADPTTTTTIGDTTTTTVAPTTTTTSPTTTSTTPTTTVDGTTTTTTVPPVTTIPVTTIPVTTIPTTTVPVTPTTNSTTTTTAVPTPTTTPGAPPTTIPTPAKLGSGGSGPTTTTWVPVYQPLSASISSSSGTRALAFTGFAVLNGAFLAMILIGVGLGLIHVSRSGALAVVSEPQDQ